MNRDIVHCSSDQLNALIDLRLSSEEEESVRAHLRTCALCSRAHSELMRFDASLKKVPLEYTRPGFTQSVLALLPSRRTSPLAFRVLEKFAYVLALMVVMGAMVIAFVLSGVIDTEQISQTRGVVSGVSSAASGIVASGLNAFGAWLISFFPFLLGKGSLNVAIFGFGVAGLLAAVDRLVEKRALRRVQ